ncbi:ion channel [Piscinibacter sakaiensis]
MESPPARGADAGRAAGLLVALVCCLLVLASTVLHYEVLRGLNAALPRVRIPARLKLVVVILAAFIAHAAEIGLYGSAMYALVALGQVGSLVGSAGFSFSSCIYFSAETYTSLGFGDLTPTGPLRLLAGVEALNGLLLIGWSASFTYIATGRGCPSDPQRARTTGTPAAARSVISRSSRVVSSRLGPQLSAPVDRARSSVTTSGPLLPPPPQAASASASETGSEREGQCLGMGWRGEGVGFAQGGQLTFLYPHLMAASPPAPRILSHSRREPLPRLHRRPVTWRPRHVPSPDPRRPPRPSRPAPRGRHRAARRGLGEQLRLQMVAQHDQASRKHLQVMLDVAQVLTPEQRAKIGERMAQAGERWRHRGERPPQPKP